VLDRITAPTLLIQGESDTLFPLAEADATARGLAAHGTPVRVAWFTGGHDTGAGPPSDQDRVRFLTAQWLDQLKGDPAPSRSFTFSRISGIDAVNRETVATGYSVADYPGLAGQRTTAVPVAGPPQRVANPPNGTPSAVSSVPQVSQLANLVGGAGVAGALSGEIPGQYAGFVSAPLPSSVDIVGAATVQIKAASPTGEAVLFVKLREISPDGQTALVEGAMAPVRLRGLPASIDAARPVTVTLPAVVHRLEAGQRVWLTISTADQAYAGPPAPTTYTVAVAGPLTLPEVTASPIPNPNLVWRWVLVALVGALVLGLVAVLIATRRRRPGVEADSDVPLVVSGLRKVYGDGFVAVSKVDFTVHRGQVVGLLGPNGAGKTTALRVLLGLIRPTAGEILVFGQRLVPGAPVLARVGALVEGPGFLPHLSGLANLTTFWRATGRPADQSRLAEVLDIAGLGDDIHRKVRTYSHGMKQRLAIAQAMLGMPELLVLDEPTDGLDPPQIAEMRRVLQRYATDGRAVLVSSHLLAEVEQTCTDVVVVHRGEIVASGPVADIVGESPTVHLAVSDVDAAATVLDGLDGIRSVQRDGPGGLTVDIDGRPRAAVVEALVQAGIGVDRVVPRRRLEDAFLALVREGASDEPAH
jgi:ABC-2 type transport system ATP-binding protein